MKILVTGATGRIGHHLIELLRRRGAAVRAFVLPGDPLPTRIAHPDVEIVEGLLTDRATLLPAVAGIDAVFHLMAPHAFAYDTFVQHLAKLTGWPIVEVTVSWTLHLDFSIAKARAILGYNPARDIFQMLDDGWQAVKTGMGE